MSWRTAAAIFATPHRLAHAAFFTFAIAALIALSLTVPARTTRAEEILLFGTGLWAVSTGARYIWNKQSGNDDAVPITFEPASLFLVVLVCTYVIFAFDATSDRPRFSPASPEALPGLRIDVHVYYGLLLSYTVIFVAWYAQQAGRILESALAVQVVLLSLLFEPVLRTESGVPVLVLTAMALALARAWPWDGDPRPVDRAVLWLAVPLAAFVAVAAIATVFAAYVHDSLGMTARMAALAFIALLAFDVVREERQRWLIWLAVVAPCVTTGALITAKVVDIMTVMGFSFAVRNRFELITGMDPNPVGLSFALGIVLVAAAMPRMSVLFRLLAVCALALMLPAFVVSYSVTALLGLGAGLATLVVLYLTRVDWRSWRSRAQYSAPLGFIALGIVVIALFVVPPPTRNGLNYTFTDPSTGRSRVNIWNWSLRDFKEHPVLGVGPGYYRGRTEYVPDFPFRDVTKMLERRRLLGGDGGQWRILVYSHPHSLLLAVAEGMGIVGLVALSGIAGFVVIGAWRILRGRDRPDWWFSGAGLAMLATVFMWTLMSLGQNITILPLLGWLALGMIALALHHDDDRPLALPRLLGEGAVRNSLAAGAAMLALLAFVVRPIGSLAAFSAGNERYLGGDREGAESLENLAATLDPTFATPPRSAAFSDLQFGRTAEAVDSLQESVARNPNDPLTLIVLGYAQWIDGDVGGAERSFRTAVRNDPWQAQGWDAYTPLALLLVSQGHDDEAMRTFADGFWTRAGAVRDTAWLYPAEDAGTDDILLDAAYSPGSDAGTLKVQLQRRLNIFVLGEEEVSGTIEITPVFSIMEQRARDELTRDPTNGVEMLVHVASVLNAAGRSDEARRVLLDAVAVEPDASYVRYDLATTYRMLEDKPAATEQLQEVVRIGRAANAYDVRLSFAERDLAAMALDDERYEDAITLMRSALDDYRWSYLPLSYYVLAKASQELGRFDDAAEWSRKESFLNGR